MTRIPILLSSPHIYPASSEGKPLDESSLSWAARAKLIAWLTLALFAILSTVFFIQGEVGPTIAFAIMTTPAFALLLFAHLATQPAQNQG